MILFLSGVRGDTRRYRAFHPYQQLQMAGLPCAFAHVTASDLARQVAKARVLVLHRVPMDGKVARLVDQARRQAALILVDVDDLTFDPQAFQWINSPDFQDPIRRRIYQRDMLRQRATIQASDGVLASTHFLADQVREVGQPAWVHRNGFSLEMQRHSQLAYQARTSQADRVVIGYASGTPTHDRDFALVRPALLDLLAEHAHVQLHLVGPLNPGEGFDVFGERVRRLPLVSWRALPGVLSQFDINLAPLVVDNPFSQSKSEIKYMEAAMVGVPTVASPTDAFRFAIRPGENGLLAEDAEAWLSNLTRLVVDPDLRCRMGELAYRRVLAEYQPAARAAQMVALLDEINTQVKGTPLFHTRPVVDPGTTIVDIPEEWERAPSNFQRGVYSLQHRGIAVLLGEIWIYFRRLLAPIFPFGPSS